jgi:CBS-domain-containing membrane protein
MKPKGSKVGLVTPTEVRSDEEKGLESAAAPVPKAAPAPSAHSPWVASPVCSFVGSFLGLGGLFVIENFLRTVHALPDPMLAVGSFAAVATLMYAAPAAPLGKPWNLFYGHFLSIVVSIAVHYAGDAVGWHPDLSVALSPSLSIAVMVQQKVPHPPAAACAFIFASSIRAHAQPLGGVVYLLVPGLLGCAYMLLVQWSVHAAADWLYAMVVQRRPPPDGR